MTVTKKEYNKMAQKASPGTTYGKNMLMAFLFGGTICTLGQGILNLYLSWGIDQQAASAFVSITLIALSAILTALRVYDNLAKYGGAGTLVPITGFANSIVAPAMEFKSEGYVIGIGGKMFVIAGPVLVYGTAASILYGLILWFFHLY
ncbi:MAG: stage V sporulation protein AC [Oscillospiraceae bacterium]|jgi:stage V sporulation protein AC|nr:stage V sporulation protein AC [Oscillospiraceae bacterium]